MKPSPGYYILIVLLTLLSIINNAQTLRRIDEHQVRLDSYEWGMTAEIDYWKRRAELFEMQVELYGDMCGPNFSFPDFRPPERNG